jgi:hypothetical protein
LCSFDAQTGGGRPSSEIPRTINFLKTDGTDCLGRSDNAVPGGFAWLQTTDNKCATRTEIATTPFYSDPGKSLPQVCKGDPLTDVHDKTVLLPVFRNFDDSGSNAWYEVYAYAAFHLTGYNFGGPNKWNPPCKGEEHCIRGYFTNFVDASDAFTYNATAPNLGASVVALTP